MIQVNGLKKAFDGFVALNGVDMHVEKGAIYGLVGPNGAGKSTLIRHLTGVYRPDQGEVQIDGENVYENKAVKSKIAYIPDELFYFMQADTMEMKRFYEGIYPSFDGKLFYRMQEFFPNIDVKRNIRRLSKGMQKQVAFWLAICCKPDILILDEPTAPLSVAEVEILFRIVRKLRNQGVAIIFISHRLDEVFELTDRVSILRDGEYITTLKTAETNRAELIRYMVGREMTATFPPRNAKIGDVALELRNLTGNGVKNISFKARRGEILGISGLVGAGRTEIMKVVFGAEKAQWGEIYVNGKKADIRSPKDAMHKYGICLIPEDRKREGCFLGETISWNLVYNVVEKISHGGVVDRKKEAEIANYYGEAMRIKAPNLDATKVGTLSGGNQQKVVVGKALATQSDIVIFDEPTRGIDVGAKYEIYELMNGLCEEGKCVVMVTSDMEELLGMSDRIVVFGEKCLAGELTKEEFSQERILDMASTSDRENENMGA